MAGVGGTRLGSSFAGGSGWGGWGGRGFGGFGRGFGFGFGYPFFGFGFGYPFFGYGFGWGGLLYGLGFGLGYGLLGGYGGWGYGGYGYGGYGYGGGYGGGCCGYGGYGSGYGAGNYAYDPYGQGYSAYNDPNAAAGAGLSGTNLAQAQTSSTLAALGNDPAASAKEFAGQGENAFKAGDYKGAVYAWRHSAIDDPQNGVLIMLLAQGLFATGKFDEAAGATQAAMHLLPKDQWGVVVSNSKELYGNIQDYTDQLRALEKAVKDKPDSPALRFLAGFHYAYLGFPKEAVDQLNRALKIQPRDEMSKQLRDEMQAKIPKPVTPSAAPPAPEIRESLNRSTGTPNSWLAEIRDKIGMSWKKIESTSGLQ